MARAPLTAFDSQVWRAERDLPLAGIHMIRALRAQNREFAAKRDRTLAFGRGAVVRSPADREVSKHDVS